MNIRELLPASSFVTITAHRLACPRVAWVAASGDAQRDVLQHAFCMQIAGEPTDAFTGHTRDYYVERYGGFGVGANGGGARCGMAGGIQIKGIGKTQLVSAKADTEHAYGGAAMQEAVREALWGEVCDIALPYGATRVSAILETGTEVRNFGQASPDARSPRVLILREPVLRPAHFMRAERFVPTAPLPVSDVARTAAAVKALPRALRQAYGCGGRALPNLDREATRQCLIEMACRFGAQQAAAQAKRLVHGALGASNIALDGRWLDFGTLGMARDYGRAVVTIQPDASLQFTMLVQPLQELCFYLTKYLPDAKATVPAAVDLAQVYLRTYAERLHLEFAKLTGIPESALIELDPALIERFCAVVQTVIARGNRYPFDLYAWHLPATSGRYHLNTILRVLAAADSAEAADVAVAPLLSESPLRRALVDAYWALRSAYVEPAYGTRKSTTAPHLELNALRVNTVVADLSRPALDRAIERLVNEREPLAPFIAHRVREGATYLAEPIAGSICVAAMLGARSAEREHVELSPRGDAKARNILDWLHRLQPAIPTGSPYTLASGGRP